MLRGNHKRFTWWLAGKQPFFLLTMLRGGRHTLLTWQKDGKHKLLFFKQCLEVENTVFTWPLDGQHKLFKIMLRGGLHVLLDDLGGKCKHFIWCLEENTFYLMLRGKRKLSTWFLTMPVFQNFGRLILSFISVTNISVV